jgi:hypothetical protein
MLQCNALCPTHAAGKSPLRAATRLRRRMMHCAVARFGAFTFGWASLPPNVLASIL